MQGFIRSRRLIVRIETTSSR